jgi:hypothetical protein
MSVIGRSYLLFGFWMLAFVLLTCIWVCSLSNKHSRMEGAGSRSNALNVTRVHNLLSQCIWLEIWSCTIFACAWFEGAWEHVACRPIIYEFAWYKTLVTDITVMARIWTASVSWRFYMGNFYDLPCCKLSGKGRDGLQEQLYWKPQSLVSRLA